MHCDTAFNRRSSNTQTQEDFSISQVGVWISVLPLSATWLFASCTHFSHQKHGDFLLEPPPSPLTVIATSVVRHWPTYQNFLPLGWDNSAMCSTMISQQDWSPVIHSDYQLGNTTFISCLSFLSSPLPCPPLLTICIKILSQGLLIGELKLGQGLAVNKVAVM